MNRARFTGDRFPPWAVPPADQAFIPEIGMYRSYNEALGRVEWWRFTSMNRRIDAEPLMSIVDEIYATLPPHLWRQVEMIRWARRKSPAQEPEVPLLPGVKVMTDG